jgi:phosphomannomutase
MSNPWKACDIRGGFPGEVSPHLFRRLGAAVGSILPVGARVLVAGDHRGSTPLLKAVLMDSLEGAGSWVLDAGQIPTPIAYFAHRQWKTDAVAIVTASHNPADHNGLKLMLGNLPPTPQDFQQLRQRVEGGHFRRHQGGLEAIDPVPAYKHHVLEGWNHLRRAEGMAVVLDAGNGAWSDLGPEIFASLGFRVVPLFCKIDGAFPCRPPDSARPNNLSALRKEVVRSRAQLGVAWDGDGDRVAFVDSSGSMVSTDEVSALMIRDLVPREKGPKVIYDLKLSDLVRQAVTDCGGIPIMERSGHAFIKRSMITLNGLFGCEVSGHYFFRELGGGDDGLFAALFVAELVQRRGVSLADLRRKLGPSFVTPDLRIPLRVISFADVVARFRNLFPDSRETTVDGIRWETRDGFILARESVTEPLVTMRLEGRGQASLDHLVKLCLKTFPEAAGEISKQIDQAREQ